MATAISSPRSGEIKLEYGRTETFALKFTAGKNVRGNYGDRVMFTLTDERKLWLDPEDASDLEIRIRELGVNAGDLIRITKIRMARGGGHALRVERAEHESGSDRAMVEKLERSIEIARSRPVAAAPAQAAETSPIQITPASARMCAAMCAAVEAAIETQTYAARKGLGLTFSEESVRAIGLSIYISDCKGGR